MNQQKLKQMKLKTNTKKGEKILCQNQQKNRC